MKLRDGLRLRRCASLVIARWIRGHACVSLFISVCVWMFIMAGNDNRRRSEPFRKTTTMKMGRRLVWPHLLYHTRRKTNLFGCFFFFRLCVFISFPLTESTAFSLDSADHSVCVSQRLACRIFTLLSVVVCELLWDAIDNNDLFETIYLAPGHSQNMKCA